jgi:hypothetical protein
MSITETVLNAIYNPDRCFLNVGHEYMFLLSEMPFYFIHMPFMLSSLAFRVFAAVCSFRKKKITRFRFEVIVLLKAQKV